MKIIVNIPNEMYDWIDNGFPDEDDYVMLWKEIKQGISFEEELEKIKQEIQSIIALADSRGEDTKLAYQCQTVITERISELKENNTQKSEPDDFHKYWDEMAISELKG